MGRQTFAGGTEFDIRGRIRLAAGPTSTNFPDEVQSLPIAQKGRRLHFLHTAQNKEQPDGTEIGIYRVHYADGQQTDIPILYGAHVRSDLDLVDPKGPKKTLAGNTRVAWEEAPESKAMRLFEMTWENERPDVMIESLDFISRKTGTEPILFAITVEP